MGALPEAIGADSEEVDGAVEAEETVATSALEPRRAAAAAAAAFPLGALFFGVGVVVGLAALAPFLALPPPPPPVAVDDDDAVDAALP